MGNKNSTSSNEFVTFVPIRKTKMAALASDCHFRLLLQNPRTELDESCKEAKFKVLYQVCAFGADQQSKIAFLAHLSRRFKWAFVIAHRPSSVRPSVVRPSVRRPSVRPSVRPASVHKLSHFQHLLQNRLMDFDETWYAWSAHGPLQVFLFFGQIGPGVDPGRGKNRSRGVPVLKKLLLQTGRLQQQTEYIAMI